MVGQGNVWEDLGVPQGKGVRDSFFDLDATYYLSERPCPRKASHGKKQTENVTIFNFFKFQILSLLFL